MGYDEGLADRVRNVLAARSGVVEQQMFGGLAFMVRGHMCCGVLGTDLVVRVGPKHYLDALSQPHAREMDFTGRPLRSMVFVGAAGLRTQKALASWVARGVAFVETLPRKTKRRPVRASKKRR